MVEKSHILNTIGSLFITLGIAAIGNAIYLKDYAGILWFCYFGLIMIGISILKKDSSLLAAQLNIFTIPLTVWTIDFFYALANGPSLFGIVDYFFTRGPLLAKLISMQHIFTIPLSFYALFLMRLKRKDTWKLSFVEIGVVYIITFLLTPEQKNVNCIYRPCMEFIPNVFYPLIWFGLLFLIILLTNILINKVFISRKR